MPLDNSGQKIDIPRAPGESLKEGDVGWNFPGYLPLGGQSATQLIAGDERGLTKVSSPLHACGATDTPADRRRSGALVWEASLIAASRRAFSFAWALFRSTFCMRD